MLPTKYVGSVVECCGIARFGREGGPRCRGERNANAMGRPPILTQVLSKMIFVVQQRLILNAVMRAGRRIYRSSDDWVVEEISKKNKERASDAVSALYGYCRCKVRECDATTSDPSSTELLCIRMNVNGDVSTDVEISNLPLVLKLLVPLDRVGVREWVGRLP